MQYFAQGQFDTWTGNAATKSAITQSDVDRSTSAPRPLRTKSAESLLVKSKDKTKRINEYNSIYHTQHEKYNIQLSRYSLYNRTEASFANLLLTFIQPLLSALMQLMELQ